MTKTIYKLIKNHYYLYITIVGMAIFLLYQEKASTPGFISGFILYIITFLILYLFTITLFHLLIRAFSSQDVSRSQLSYRVLIYITPLIILAGTKPLLELCRIPAGLILFFLSIYLLIKISTYLSQKYNINFLLTLLAAGISLAAPFIVVIGGGLLLIINFTTLLS
ncbi:MAG TPA: hypothetical protein VKS21_14035 [Spirochaetota bacterium]|nr:hypothetical protein [Spirochaetota bacterium]